jgi:hypothetical protein
MVDKFMLITEGNMHRVAFTTIFTNPLDKNFAKTNIPKMLQT